MTKANNGEKAGDNRRSLKGAANAAAPAVRLHRLRTARLQEGLSRRTAARKLGFSESEVKHQECETTDLPLSILHRWAKLLKVPVFELVREPDESLALPLLRRASMVRLMKTAAAILERAGDKRMRRLSQQMIDQLIEIMPELRDVTAWPEVGRSRGVREYGRAFLHRLSARVFCDVEELS
jgi:transcriptional regulator with XRE-family HTH domain